MKRKMSASNRIWSVVMTIVCVIYLYPIFMVLSNSLKVESAISTGTAFELPNAQTFAGLANYENAIGAQGFLASFSIPRSSRFPPCWRSCCSAPCSHGTSRG